MSDTDTGTAPVTEADIKAALAKTKKTPKVKAEKAPKAAKEPKEPKEPKPAKEPKAARAPGTGTGGKFPVSGFEVAPATTIITMGTDSSGTLYSPSNVPFRPDSKRAERFLLLVNGMTIEDAGKAGVIPRRVKKMALMGVIKLTNGDGTPVVLPVMPPRTPRPPKAPQAVADTAAAGTTAPAGAAPQAPAPAPAQGDTGATPPVGGGGDELAHEGGEEDEAV